MEFWHPRAAISRMPTTSADQSYQLRASDVLALVTLVVVIILSPILFDLATALGISR